MLDIKTLDKIHIESYGKNVDHKNMLQYMDI